MFYPVAWDITPITITKTTKTYNGISEDSTEAINVRMQFGFTKVATKNSITTLCTGLFYKQGTLDVSIGDTVTFEDNTYEIVSQRDFRLDNGVVVYTKVWFK